MPGCEGLQGWNEFFQAGQRRTCTAAATDRARSSIITCGGGSGPGGEGVGEKEVHKEGVVCVMGGMGGMSGVCVIWAIHVVCVVCGMGDMWCVWYRLYM